MCDQWNRVQIYIIIRPTSGHFEQAIAN